MKLHGSVAVVTGASAGIGRATALALAREGASVVVAARREPLLRELALRIEKQGGVAVPVECDVSEPGQVEALRTRAWEAFGRCDVLVNNAGIPGGSPFADLSLEQVERIVRTNYLGVLYCTKAFLPMMLEARRGHIVNVASLAGLFPVPGASVYSSTKHAVVAFSEALHYELAHAGILVTAVNPGLVRTDGFPQTHVDPRIVMKPERVAGAIVRVVRGGIAPQYSLPRWLSPLQAFRVLTPPLYRWGVRKVRDAGSRSTRTRR